MKQSGMNAIKNKLIDACIILTITVAMLASLEIAAWLARQVKIVVLAWFDDSSEYAIQRKQAWGVQHRIDQAGATGIHMTYVEFREKPYGSPTLNIDSEGRRRVPGSCEKQDAFTVLTFGGSTMYGYGVPDQYTIPAYLSELLNRGSRCVRVVNYGSAWWQSSQSLIQLIEILKNGIRPQVVIFYDGINEIDAVASGGTPGGIDPEAEALLKTSLEPDIISVPRRIAQGSLFVRAIKRYLLSPNDDANGDSEKTAPEGAGPGSPNALVDVYATNIRTVDALAKEFEFAAYFFLQPSPITAAKKNTVFEESALKDRAKGREWETDFFRQSYRTFSRNPYLSGNVRYHDISAIFDNMQEELYLDTEHLLPEGNKLVAERIAREIPLPPPAP